MEAGPLDGLDCLECQVACDRDVTEELAALGIGNDSALVADHRVSETGLVEVGPNRTEHAARDDDHVTTRVTRCRKRGERARPQHRVLGDQRPVEIARERVDLRGKVARKVYGVPPVALTT
jgi:hypothetical protein